MSITNQIKTFVLLGTLTALLLFVGTLFGPTGFYFAIFFVIIMNLGSYWFSDKIVLKMSGAKLVTKKEYSEFYEIVHEVAHLAKIPTPKIYVIPSQAPNAFATGRNPKHSAVAATEGILKLLTKQELKGVMAHEIAHIKNRDILIATIAAMVAGVISYLAMIARWGAIFGGRGDRENSGIELLVLAIIAPIMSLIIQMAISRSREFLADETGAKLIKNGPCLADALEKISKGIDRSPQLNTNKATASLYIANPFKGKSLLNLFSTHPKVEDRIRRLKNIN